MAKSIVLIGISSGSRVYVETNDRVLINKALITREDKELTFYVPLPPSCAVGDVVLVRVRKIGLLPFEYRFSAKDGATKITAIVIKDIYFAQKV